MTNDSAPSTLDSEVSFADLTRRLRNFGSTLKRQRGMLVLPLAVSVAIGVFVAFGSGPEYIAGAKLVPYRSGGNGQSGLAGLAGLAGVRLSQGLPGDFVITADIYPEVVRTLDFQIVVAESPIRFSGRSSSISPAAYFASIYRPSPVELVGRYSVGLPGLLVEAFRSSSDAVNVSAPSDSFGLRVLDRSYVRRVRKIGDRIGVSVDRRTGVISVTTSMPDAIAAASLVRTVADRLTKTVIDFEVRKANEQLAYIDEQYMLARTRYDKAQRLLAAFADGNRSLTSATAQIEQQRLARDASFAFETFERMAREREQAILKRNQDTPVFAMLEMPSVPTERSEPKRARLLLLSLLLGVAAGVVRVAVSAHRLGSTLQR